MKWIFTILLVIGLTGCGKLKAEKNDIVTIITRNEITVEWKEGGLHRKLWVDISNSSVTLLKERKDGYVDWFAERGICWDTAGVKVDSNPWEKNP